VHMNGRVYDPVVGRFLSADPFVDGVTDSQGYNRYSYVGNNPLGATDPTGFVKFKEVLPAIVGVVVGGIVTAFLGPQGGMAIFKSWSAFWGGLKAGLASGAAVWGGASGGFSSGFSGSLLNGGSIGDAFKTGAVGAATGAFTAWAAGQIGGFFDVLEGGGSVSFGTWGGRTVSHALVGGLASEAQGGEFRHGFYSSFASAGVMHIPGVAKFMGGDAGGAWIAARTTVAATIGGTASVLAGGKFANGAVTSAFQHLFNQESGSNKKVNGQYVHEETVEWYEQFAEESWITNHATILVGYDIERINGVDVVAVRDVQLGYNWMDGKGLLEEVNASPSKYTAKIRIGYRHELTVNIIVSSLETGRAVIDYKVDKYFYAYGSIGAWKLKLKTPQMKSHVETAKSGAIYIDPPRRNPVITLAPEF